MIHGLRRLQQGDLITAIIGGQTKKLDESAHLVNFNRLALFYGMNAQQIGMIAAGQQATGAALAAGQVVVGFRLLAQQAPGQFAGEFPAPTAFGAGQQQGMRQAVLLPGQSQFLPGLMLPGIKHVAILLFVKAGG